MRRRVSQKRIVSLLMLVLFCEFENLPKRRPDRGCLNSDILLYSTNKKIRVRDCHVLGPARKRSSLLDWFLLPCTQSLEFAISRKINYTPSLYCRISGFDMAALLMLLVKNAVAV
jgi:hypothetical protein